MKSIRDVLAEARLGCTYLNDTIGGGERIKYAAVDADHIIKKLDLEGYEIVPKNSVTGQSAQGSKE